MENQVTPAQVADLEKRIKILEANVALPTHYHNGFDSNQISYLDLYQKKIYVQHTIVGTDAATATNYGVFYILPVACIITRIQEVHQTAGTDAGAVTLAIEKLTGTQAPDSGSSTQSGTFDLKGTANTLQTGVLTTTASAKTFSIGDRLCMKDSGTLTAVANVTVLIELQF